MKKRTAAFLTLFLFSFTLFSQKDSSVVRKEYTTSRAMKSPKIDGMLDDETWQNITPITDFKQNNPEYGVPTYLPTEVKIVYDNTAIYVAAMMYDTSPDSITKQLGNRDDDLNADMFQIKFDTYNKQQDAFVFGLYASGVQIDNRFSDGLYSAVWESAVKINEKGWALEMKIPYSALRFPNSDVQLWAMQIVRITRRNGKADQWALTPKGDANFYKYWGFLKGLDHIQEPIRLSLTPYITAIASHYPANIPGQSNYTKSLTGGMDLKFGINESFTVDATLLPDFSQVQSDNVVKNLSAFEVTYSEQRPFFQESTDLFQKGDLFYSRRIGRRPTEYYNVYNDTTKKETILKNPDQAKLLNATKVSGRTPGGLGIGLLNAVLDNTYATERDSTGHEHKVLTEPFSNYNIFVLDQQLKNSSSVYLINTNVNRSKGYNNADVTGAGVSLNNKKSTYNVFAQAAMSNVFSKNDTVANQYADLFGYKYDLRASKISGKFQFTIFQSAINSSFNNNDMGITRETNFISQGIYMSYYKFEPFNKFLNASYSFSINRNENMTTHRTNALNINLNYNAQLKSFHYISIGLNAEPLNRIDYYESRTPGRIFIRPPVAVGSVGIYTDNRKPVIVGFNTYFGSTALVSPTIGYNPFYGIYINPIVRANNKLSFNLSCNYSIDDGDRGWVGNDEWGNIIFGVRKRTDMENIVSARYLFKNNLSLSLRVRQYWSKSHYKSFCNLKDDGFLMDNISYDVNHDFNFNAVNVDMVFLWQFAPGSSLNLVWKNSIYQQGDVVISSYSQNLNSTLQANQLNTVSLKVLYYLDYLYLVKKKN